MTVEVLKVLNHNPAWSEADYYLPRCECSVKMAGQYEWRKRMHVTKSGRYGEGRVDQCTRDGVVKIDGVPMCRRHAGELILDRYIEGKIVDVR